MRTGRVPEKRSIGNSRKIAFRYSCIRDDQGRVETYSQSTSSISANPTIRFVCMKATTTGNVCSGTWTPARSEGVVQTADPDLLPAVKANRVSCLLSGCHDVLHIIGQLSSVKC